MGVAEPAVKNTNYKERRSHNTAEPINGISKIAHCATSIPAPNNNDDDGPTMMEEGRMAEDFRATGVKPLKLVSYRAYEV
jgi:hypothetical protein